jgi:hypothetical protein
MDPKTCIFDHETMNELPLESSENDAMMKIDIFTLSKDWNHFLLFLSILLIAFFSGLFGPSVSIVEHSIESFDQFREIDNLIFLFFLTNLSYFTKYVEISIILERKQRINPILGGIFISIDVSDGNFDFNLKSQTYHIIPEYLNLATNSKILKIYEDNDVNYLTTSIQFQFSSHAHEFQTATFIFRIGNMEYIIYEMLHRFFFSFTLIIFCTLLFMVLKMKKNSLGKWSKKHYSSASSTCSAQ